MLALPSDNKCYLDFVSCHARIYKKEHVEMYTHTYRYTKIEMHLVTCIHVRMCTHMHTHRRSTLPYLLYVSSVL